MVGSVIQWADFQVVFKFFCFESSTLQSDIVATSHMWVFKFKNLIQLKI